MKTDPTSNVPSRWGRRRRLTAAVPRLAATGALLASLSAALVAPVAAQGDPDLPSTAAAVPEDALFYLSVELDLSADQWTQADDLLTRAGAPGALQQLRSSILDDTGLATPTAGEEADPLFGGELGVVLTELPDVFTQAFEMAASGTPSVEGTPDLPDLANEPGPVFVLEPGDADAAFDVVEDQLARAAEDAGRSVEEITYGDVAIQAVDSETGPDLAVAQLDDFIVAAFKPADLEPIIDTAAGDNPNLADLEAFADIRAELNPELLVFGFAAGDALRDAFGPNFQQAIERSAELNEAFGIASPVPQQDLAEINLGVALWADDLGLRTDTVTVNESGEQLPVVIQSGESELDARMPANTLVFANAFDLGPSGVLSAGVGLQLALAINQGVLEGTPVAMVGTTPTIDRLTPEYVEEQFAQAADELGFDLRTDLLNQLVGEHAFSLALTPALLAGNVDEGFDAVFASGLDDPTVVTDSAERVARLLERDAAQADVSTRQLGGDTVYVVTDPEAEGQGMPSLEFGVVEDQLLIGIGDGIDRYVEGPDEALADDERYRRVMATLPSEYQGSVYVNVGQIVGLFQLATAGMMAGPDATPVASPDPSTPTSAVEAFASVVTTEDDVQRVSSILYIGGA